MQPIGSPAAHPADPDRSPRSGRTALWGTLIGAITLGVANKFLEPLAGAVFAKIIVLALIILFIQRRPRGLFALRGRAVES